MTTSRANFNPTQAAAAFVFGRRNKSATSRVDVPKVEQSPLDNIPDSAPTADTWEAARQRHAAARGWAYLPPKAADVQPNATCETFRDPDGGLKCDVELARICVGLRQSAQLRLWLVIQEHVRTSGFNYINRLELSALLDQHGIKHSRHNLNRWLRAGQGVYWRLTTYGRVYLISYERLATTITLEAATHDLPDLPDLAATNIPGMRLPMYVKVESDNLQTFEAHVFAAWHASKNNMPISRYSLQRLFNRDTKTMIEWQGIANITILHGFVHYTEEFSHDVPHAPEGGLRGGVIEYEVNKQKRWSAEYSNSYQTKRIRQHDKRGASRRVFAKIRELIQSVEPTSIIRAGTAAKRRRPGGLSRTGKYLFQDAKRARASAKHHDSPRAIFKGIDNRRGIHFEHSPDGRERTRAKSCYDASRIFEGVGRNTDKSMESVYQPF